MWVFLSARLRAWLFAAVLLPLARSVAGAAATRLESSRGPSDRAVRVLRRVSRARPPRRRGLLRRRRH